MSEEMSEKTTVLLEAQVQPVCYWTLVQGTKGTYTSTCGEQISPWFGVMMDEINHCHKCGGELNPSPLKEVKR